MLCKTNLAAVAKSLYLTLANKMKLHTVYLTKSLLTALSSNEIHFMAITWKEIVEETLNDKVLSRVTRCIEDGRSLKLN